MCFVCAEVAEAAAAVTIMALPFRKRIWKWIKDKFQYCEGQCLFTIRGVEYEPGRSRYEWDGQGVDPNKGSFLCRDCAKGYHEYWDEMLAVYYSDKL